MAGFYNPSTPETLGLEWLVTDDPSTYVLDSAAKAFGVVIDGETLRMSQELAAYAIAISGQGHFGCEILSAPYVEAIPQSFTTFYAGTDTGADFTSPTNSNNAWLTQAGGAASYASVSPGVDDSTYLRNVNQQELPAAPARMMMRGAGASALGGKRILGVELHVRIKVTLSTTPVIKGCLNISGVDYESDAAAVPVGQGYVDMVVALWLNNPSTNKPWTLASLNNLVTTGATDEFGMLLSYDARATTTYSDTIRVSSVHLIVRWQPEDRVGYASGDVSATGWHTWTSKSVPNLLNAQDSNLEINTGSTGSWTADANTTLTNDADDRGAPWTRSLKMVATASGNFGATSGFIPAIAGKTYAFRNYSKVTSGRTTTLSILFFDANGNLLETASSGGDAGTGSYKTVGMTAAATAPTGTTQMKLHIVTNASAGAQTCFSLQNFVGLDQTAINFVRDSYPGALTVIKVDGATEVNEIAHPLTELRIFRRISGKGNMSLPTFGPGASAVGMPLGMFSYRPTLQDDAGALLRLNAATTDVPAFVTTSLHNWDAANGPIAALSQPYAERISGAVYTGNTIKAELTLPAKTYVAFRLVMAGQINEPAADLNIKLKKTSDNSQVGGTAVVEPTDLVEIIPPGGSTASRTTPQVFVVAIPTPAANLSAQYYVEFTSTAAQGSGWLIYALDDMGYTGDSVSADTIIFGAAVDAWINPADGGEQTRRNAMVTVQTQPAAPTGLTATLSDSDTRVHLEWDPTALGAAFDGLEIWRDDDRSGIDDLGYMQIADIDDEAVSEFYDAESRRGYDAVYKIRLRRTDGSFSEFSTETAGVATDAECGPTWWFVSNEAAMSAYVGGMQLQDDEWGQPNEPVIQQYHGRPGAVAWIELADPYDEFDITAVLYWSGNLVESSFLDAPPASGRAAFNALYELSRLAISYVCILDDEGGRWFSNIRVGPQRRGREAGANAGRYSADIHVRELQRISSTPIASA